MSYLPVINVLDYGVVPNDSTTATSNVTNLNACIVNATNGGGGIVYLPKGIYYINGTILMKNNVKLLGESNTSFGYKEHYPLDLPFLNNFRTIITALTGSSQYNMIQFDNDDDNIDNDYKRCYQGSEISGLCLFGNKGSSNCLNGIHIKDYYSYVDSPRGHLRFKNLMIYQFNGDGFYNGNFQNEIYIDEVNVFDCDQNGFYLCGQDNKITRAQSAANDLSGFYIAKGGAGRFYDIDCWNNNYGIEIVDTMNHFFFGFSANQNNIGLYIHPGSVNDSYSPLELNFFRGTFDANNLCDIKVHSENPNMGPSYLTFNNCMFRGKESGTKANYAIMDTSYYPSRNIISECIFIKNNYAVRLINLTTIYKFRDCYDYSNRGVIEENSNNYKLINTNYNILTTDSYISIGNIGANNIELILPVPNSCQVGKMIFVTKIYSCSGYATLSVAEDYDVLGDIEVRSLYDTLMIVNAGGSWYSMKIK